MNQNQKTYKNKFISIDINQNQFKREFDKNWQKIPQVAFVALTQVKMQQTGGGRGGRIKHNTKVCCVYINSGKLNILAYKGKRKNVIQEAQKIAALLNVEVKDLILRNPDGSIEDDDQLIEPENIQSFFIIGVIVIFVILLLAVIFS